MTRGMKIGIVVAIIVLLAGVGATLWVSSQSGEETTNTNTTTTTNTNTGNVNNTVNVNTGGGEETPITPEETVEIDDSAAVLRLARSVVARYGSFSNQNNFENITSLEPFMTADFQSRSAEYISENQANEDPGNYYGISTEVISLELVSLEGNDATVDVLSQRIEEKANEDPKIFNQTAEVVFEKVDDYWKVESITWK